MNAEQLTDFICKALDDKKAKDIVAINVNGHTSVCDYFVICSGSNANHVKALCDSLEEKLQNDFGQVIKSKEGYSEGRWIALDCGDVVVHIFNDETRLFYHLERLWTYGDNIKKYN